MILVDTNLEESPFKGKMRANGIHLNPVGIAMRPPDFDTDRALRAIRAAMESDASVSVLGGRAVPIRVDEGVWGGLWSFPECEPGHDVQDWCAEVLDVAAREARSLAPLRHGFTHFELEILPVLVEIDAAGERAVRDGDTLAWFDPHAPLAIGLAAPVARLLAELAHAPAGNQAVCPP